MLISSENFARSDFVAVPAVQNSVKHPTAFSLLIEPNEVRIENDQSSALSFNALGMFGNFDTVNFIESPSPVYTAQNDIDSTAYNALALYKSGEISQYSNSVIFKQESKNIKYNFSTLIIKYENVSKKINNLLHNDYINSGIRQRSEANFRSTYLNYSKFIHNRKVQERVFNLFQLRTSQKDGQFFVSLTGSVFDLTNSLKMRDVASSILEKFGIKNGILYINAINVTKAYYFIREENHGSGTR